ALSDCCGSDPFCHRGVAAGVAARGVSGSGRKAIRRQWHPAALRKRRLSAAAQGRQDQSRRGELTNRPVRLTATLRSRGGAQRLCVCGVGLAAETQSHRRYERRWLTKLRANLSLPDADQDYWVQFSIA